MLLDCPCTIILNKFFNLLHKSVDLIEHSLVSELPQYLTVSWQGIEFDSPVSEVIQDVAEMSTVPIYKYSAVVFYTYLVATAKHGCQHGLGIPS